MAADRGYSHVGSMPGPLALHYLAYLRSAPNIQVESIMNRPETPHHQIKPIPQSGRRGAARHLGGGARSRNGGRNIYDAALRGFKNPMPQRSRGCFGLVI